MLKKMTKKRGLLSRAAGFTMPEIIIMVAVMAIITGMAFPDLVSFLQRQQLEQEIDAQKELSKALDAYSKACLKLPDQNNNPDKDNCNVPGATGTKTWYQALGQFTNMGDTAIENDVWGNPRNYTVNNETVNYREGPLTFYYGEIRSAGPNQCDDVAAGSTEEGDVTACSTKSLSTRKAQVKSTFGDGDLQDFSLTSTDNKYFGKIKAVGDDLLTKYTDNQIKTQRYDETMDRMHRVIDALDRYAQGKFNEATLSGESCISEEIFYPPSTSSTGGFGDGWTHSDPDAPAGCTSLSQTAKYSAAVRNDVSSIVGTANIKGMNSSDEGSDIVYGQTAPSGSRLEALEGLMRVLGLPESDCCSALTGYAFYYASSPRPLLSSGSCGTMTKPPYMPPKISITNDKMCP